MKLIQQNITDVFFDLDHTLWDFEKNSALAFEKVFGLYNLKADLSEFLRFYVPINRAYWEQYRKNEISQEQLRYGRLKESFDKVEYVLSDELIDLISKEYINFLPTFNHLYDGTIELLDYLKQKYKLHIITNGFAEIQDKKLKNARINKYFKTVTNSEMAGVKKPNRQIFELALKEAQTKKENCIMIGDCLEADVEGALNAGFEAIFFNEYKNTAPKNIKQINHLLELKNYL